MEDIIDVTYVNPDPPDFAIHLKSGATVGVELTELIRSASQKRKGDRQYRLEFPEWEKKIKCQVGTVKEEFKFSNQSLRDMYRQFVRQLTNKVNACYDKKGEFSEMWVVFHIPISNPMTAVTTYNRCLEKLGNVMSRLWGRFLYDADLVFRQQEVFRTLVFFSDSSYFALTKEPTCYGGVRINKDLVTIGETVTDEEYDRFTVRATHEHTHTRWIKEEGDR
jgi:hypothetical protein